MSSTNLNTSQNYVADNKANVKKEIQAIQQVLNRDHPLNLNEENSGMSCVYNADTSNGNTILITNYSNNNNSNNTQKSSISIFTHSSDSDSPECLPTPSINILINNHFDHTNENGNNHQQLSSMETKKSIKVDENILNNIPLSAKTDCITDAGTSNVMKCQKLMVDDDVLVKRLDGRYYLGTITEIGNEKYLVKYDDDTVRWSTYDEIRKLDASDDDSKATCVVCKIDDVSDAIVNICELCCRGYHNKCGQGSFEKTGVWYCKRCVDDNKIKNKLNNSSSVATVSCYPSQLEEHPPNSSLQNLANKLPNDLHSLTWDANHRVNNKHIYCYCGKDGNWCHQMLQCARCLQWFHQKCVKCLAYPMFLGDRFYLFACLNCNHGIEFLRRLHMNIEDVVHLLLYNLTIHLDKSYFNLPNILFPYAKDNWNALQLSPKLKNMIVSDVKGEISKALRAHSDRFKFHDKPLKWGLQTKMPPEAPKIALPFGPPLTEKYLNDLFNDQARIHFLPNATATSPESFMNDSKIQDIMKRDYLRSMFDKCDSETICSDSKIVDNAKNKNAEKKVIGGVSTSSVSCIEFNQCDNTLSGYETMASKKLNLKISAGASIRKRGRPRLNALTNGLRKDVLIDLCDSSDDNSSHGTLDSIIPPLKDFSGNNNPFLIESNNSSSSNSLLNAFPPTSSSNAGHFSFSNLITASGNGNPNLAHDKGGQVRIVRTIKRRLNAKDIMIGPNMEVKRRKLRRRSGDIEVISTMTVPDLRKSISYLPIRKKSKDPSTATIRSPLNTSCTTKITKSVSTGNLTISPSNENNQTTRKLSERKLRTRQEKNYSDSQRLKAVGVGVASTSKAELTSLTNTSTSLRQFSTSNIIPGSPNKSAAQDTISDLQSTLNMYFGGLANRIGNGESFTIRGKRITSEGRTEYLIEWD